MSESDVSRVIDYHLSPMNVSLHAVSPDVRRSLMGKNAQRGMEVVEQLIEAGIEIHAQIVLIPGVNDGEELDRTLAWCAERPAISSLGIVPLGYTRFQKRFSASFSDDPAAARAVIHQVEPYQREARRTRGRTVFQLADEFYLDAGVPVPAAETYDGYPQYYDGIGMIRSYLDESFKVKAEQEMRIEAAGRLLGSLGIKLAVVSGCAAAQTIRSFVSDSPLRGSVRAIENHYFGGNVDVTGLICAEDLLAQLGSDLSGIMLFVPDVMFNADGLTLDGYHQEQLKAELVRRGARVRIASTMPLDLLGALEEELTALAPGTEQQRTANV